jgi:hypothetical protein
MLQRLESLSGYAEKHHDFWGSATLLNREAFGSRLPIPINSQCYQGHSPLQRNNSRFVKSIESFIIFCFNYLS